MNVKNVLLYFVMILLAACSNSTDPILEEPSDPDYVVLSKIYNSGIMIEVCAEDSVKIGYSTLFIALYDSASNSKLEDVTVSVNPIMHMAMHSHSAPNEGVGPKTPDGFWPCSIVFIMAGEWELHVEFYDNVSKKSGKVILPITVSPSGFVKKVTGTDSLSYFITLVEPMHPEVGLNDIEITIHVKETMMAFPPVEDLIIEMVPTMPSMGHGSPNNENPVHTAHGHYLGKVNFTMTGDWRIDLSILNDSAIIAETHFDFMF
jgi:hypothetical protein